MHTIRSTEVLHKMNKKVAVHIPYVKRSAELPVVGESVQVVNRANGAKFPGQVTSVNERMRSYEIVIDLSEEIEDKFSKIFETDESIEISKNDFLMVSIPFSKTDWPEENDGVLVRSKPTNIVFDGLITSVDYVNKYFEATLDLSEGLVK